MKASKILSCVIFCLFLIGFIYFPLLIIRVGEPPYRMIRIYELFSDSYILDVVVGSISISLFGILFMCLLLILPFVVFTKSIKLHFASQIIALAYLFLILIFTFHIENQGYNNETIGIEFTYCAEALLGINFINVLINGIYLAHKQKKFKLNLIIHSLILFIVGAVFMVATYYIFTLSIYEDKFANVYYIQNIISLDNTVLLFVLFLFLVGVNLYLIFDNHILKIVVSLIFTLVSCIFITGLIDTFMDYKIREYNILATGVVVLILFIIMSIYGITNLFINCFAKNIKEKKE